MKKNILKTILKILLAGLLLLTGCAAQTLGKPASTPTSAPTSTSYDGVLSATAHCAMSNLPARKSDGPFGPVATVTTASATVALQMRLSSTCHSVDATLTWRGEGPPPHYSCWASFQFHNTTAPADVYEIGDISGTPAASVSEGQDFVMLSGPSLSSGNLVTLPMIGVRKSADILISCTLFDNEEGGPGGLAVNYDS